MKKPCNASMDTKTEDCCIGPPARRSWGWTSLLGGAAIALLPKCPFCLLAYSSAVTMCSGASFSDHSPQWVSFISIGLAALVIFTLIRNYRGPRTAVALFLALGGSALVAYSELVSGSLWNYQIGSVLILAAALLNGGLYLFLQRQFAAFHARWMQRSAPAGVKNNRI